MQDKTPPPQKPKRFQRFRAGFKRSRAAQNANHLALTPIQARRQALRRKSIYLLPNSFTLAALFCGFYAVVQAMNKNFEYSAIAIFCSMVLDGMDGRVARMTNTQSAFGEQFDSLADMTSFGVAPALVMYEWILKDLGRWGWLAAFIYCAGAACRLARFNANIGVVDKRFFQGLPSPAAGALIAGFVWLVVSEKLKIQELQLPWVAFVLTIYAGMTMVSNAPFYSGKALNPNFRVPFWGFLIMIIVFVAVSSNPPFMLFCAFVVYGISGYIIWLYRKATGRPGIFERPQGTAPDK